MKPEEPAGGEKRRSQRLRFTKLGRVTPEEHLLPSRYPLAAGSLRLPHELHSVNPERVFGGVASPHELSAAAGDCDLPDLDYRDIRLPQRVSPW